MRKPNVDSDRAILMVNVYKAAKSTVAFRSKEAILRKVGVFLWAFFLLICLRQTQSQTSHSIPTQIPGHDAILLGTDWYPEQWPESRWEEDLRLMEAAHIKVVRIAEFAWSAMEPSEAHYDF